MASQEIIPTNHALVRLDRIAIEDYARTHGKIDLALNLWKHDNRKDAAPGFVQKMRELYDPQPASLLDTTAADPADWYMLDFHKHPFVMDGADYQNIPIRSIRSAPARITAEQTYTLTVQQRAPTLFMVTMPRRIYERALLPFFDKGGQVQAVATLVRPILARATLAEISRGL